MRIPLICLNPRHLLASALALSAEALLDILAPVAAAK